MASKPKQAMIEGTEPETIAELDVAVEQYVEARDARMSYLEKEIDRKGELKELMKKHGLDQYKFDGYQAIVEAGETNVKVKKCKALIMDEA